MAKRLSRGNVPNEFLAAKQAAVNQFLAAAQPLEALSAFAASTRPEHNVVGVGVGRKITKGKVTSTNCIRLYVARKVAKGAVPREFLLPERIRGVPTDVVETGTFRALPAKLPKQQQRIRPAQPGCSIGFRFTGSMAKFVMAGTFGGLVEAGGKRFILSNNHVLANENALAIGSPIFQPGLLDGGNPATDQIAKLTKFVTIKKNQPNAVDCAIAELLAAKNAKATFLPKVGQLKSSEPIDAVEGMRVHKVGRTTGYTRGTVFDVSADVTIKYDMGPVTFNDQVLITGDAGSFSDAGDSGSVIVDRATGRATSLLFAGSASHTIANHLSEVLAQLGVSVVK